MTAIDEKGAIGALSQLVYAYEKANMGDGGSVDWSDVDAAYGMAIDALGPDRVAEVRRQIEKENAVERADDVMLDISDRQGWDPKTCLRLALEFIQAQDKAFDLRRFLEEVASEENAACTEES